jgi:hypothetical protein
MLRIHRYITAIYGMNFRIVPTRTNLLVSRGGAGLSNHATKQR